LTGLSEEIDALQDGTTTPLAIRMLIDCALGFVAAMVWRQAWVRIVSALVVPFVVALFHLGPSFFLPLSENDRSFWSFCASFLTFGFFAATFGIALGALLRPALNMRSARDRSP
jgi:Na+/H+-dicarboxylate symporter